MIQWYAANTHVNKEGISAEHLKRQGFSVYLPKHMKLCSHARRKEIIPRPLFPRYLFVGVDLEKARWQAIQSTIGINNLVCFGSKPAPVPSEIIVALRARENERGIVMLEPKSLFKKGEAVKFMSGALCEQVGLFDHIDDKERVVILLELMGRKITVRAPIEVIQACA